jgi:hypothetical protein
MIAAYSAGYDAASQLTSITTSDGSGTDASGGPGVPPLWTTYGYDADGNRTSGDFALTYDQGDWLTSNGSTNHAYAPSTTTRSGRPGKARRLSCVYGLPHNGSG